jgi:hypothetical protein
MTEGLDFFSQWPNFPTGLAGKFSQELATLILLHHFYFRCPKYMHSILTDLYKSLYGIFSMVGREERCHDDVSPNKSS